MKFHRSPSLPLCVHKRLGIDTLSECHLRVHPNLHSEPQTRSVGRFLGRWPQPDHLKDHLGADKLLKLCKIRTRQSYFCTEIPFWHLKCTKRVFWVANNEFTLNFPQEAYWKFRIGQIRTLEGLFWKTLLFWIDQVVFGGKMTNLTNVLNRKISDGCKLT